MIDLKLFRIAPDGISELPGSGVALERSLQDLIEQNLEQDHRGIARAWTAAKRSTRKTAACCSKNQNLAMLPLKPTIMRLTGNGAMSSSI